MPSVLIPKDLVERIKEGRCLLFVGPGASLPEPGYAGPPGPAMLAAELALRLGHLPADITLPWVAQLYEGKSGKQVLHEYVATRLDDEHYLPTRQHARLLRLPFKIIVSTAYDQLLDRLARQQTPQIPIVLEEEDIRSESERQLFKLYGTVQQRGSLRLTEEDLDELLSPDVRTGLVATLFQWAHRLPALFIGYYLGDATFRRLFSRLRDKGKPYMAFIVQPEADEDEIVLWKGRGLTTFNVEPDKFLDQLEIDLAESGATLAMAIPDVPKPRQLNIGELNSLDNVVTNILERMGIRGVMEGGQQLRLAAHNLDFLRQLSTEHVPAKRPVNDSPSAAVESPMIADQAQILLQYGNAAWAERSYEQAQHYFEDALRQDPKFVDAYLSLHYLLAELGQTKSALEMYQQILSLAPEYALLPSQYDIQAVLGQNELGIRYRAWDREAQQVIAVTVLRRMYTRDGSTDALERFEEATGKLQHPRICRLLKRGYHRGHYFIVCEYVEGQQLEKRLRDKRMPLSEAYRVFDETMEALEYAHMQGVLHLGLTPANIVLAPAPQGVKLIDYGLADLAKALRLGSSDVRSLVDYQPPEQRAGLAGSEQSDIYAAGTIAYEMMAGRLPGVGNYEPPSKIYAQADVALDVFVETARAFDPAERFASVTQMRREMRLAAEGERPGGTYQTLGWVLSLISQWVERYITGWGLVGLGISLGMLMIPELILPLTHALTPALAGLLVVSRIILILGLNLFSIALIYHWLVPGIARFTGLGSLIHTGSGMGAVLGFLMGVWNLLGTYVDYISIQENPNPYCSLNTPNFSLLAWLGRLEFKDYVPVLVVSLMFTLLVIFVITSLLFFAGLLTKRVWKLYSIGWYRLFLVVCLVLVVLSALGVSHGACVPYYPPPPIPL